MHTLHLHTDHEAENMMAVPSLAWCAPMGERARANMWSRPLRVFSDPLARRGQDLERRHHACGDMVGDMAVEYPLAGVVRVHIRCHHARRQEFHDIGTPGQMRRPTVTVLPCQCGVCRSTSLPMPSRCHRTRSPCLATRPRKLPKIYPLIECISPSSRPSSSSEFIPIMVFWASHERRHHIWPVYGSSMCSPAPQRS